MPQLLKPEIRFKRRDHFTSLARNLEHMFVNEKHVDVTLKVEGKLIKAHRLILCASSPYFEELLTKHHLNIPDVVITLHGFKFKELKTLIEYMYRGEMTVLREHVPSLMETATALKIMALMEESDDGPSLDESVDIVIPNLVADESTLLDNNSNKIFIPPHVMAQVVHDDVIIDQEVNMEENPDEEEHQQPLDDDDPNPEINITHEDFNLQLSESEDDDEPSTSFAPPVLENLAPDVPGSETERTRLKRKRSHKKSFQNEEKDSDDENESTKNKSSNHGSTRSDDSSDEEATPRRFQPDRKAKYKKRSSSTTTSATGNRKKKGGARGRTSGQKGSSTALFKCKDCGRSYTKKFNLSRHSRYECGKDPSFVCHLCDYQTYYNYLLSKHLMDVHQVDVSKYRKVARFFRCDLCPFRERSLEALQKHLETRHGDGH